MNFLKIWLNFYKKFNIQLKIADLTLSKDADIENVQRKNSTT